MRAMRVLFCPDAFKGGPNALAVATALAAGWRSERPDDDLDLCPLADGGEGTLDVIAAAVPGSRVVAVPGCTGPDGRPVDGRYLLLPDGTALAELAVTSGLPLMREPAPLTATTRGLGDVLGRAVAAGAERLVVALGGSASTDGGWGALAALGLRALDARGTLLGDGGAALADVASLDRSALQAPPAGGVDVLVDVAAPLLGPSGAAVTFAPQKGATASEVSVLEAALARWADVLGGAPDASGAGAAGGTAYGLAAAWGARLVLGAGYVGDLVRLDERVAAADVVVTGEGRLDPTSLTGKVVGEVLRRAEGRRVVVVAGQVESSVLADRPDATTLSLTDLAGSAAASLARPDHFLRAAGRRMARELSG